MLKVGDRVFHPSTGEVMEIAEVGPPGYTPAGRSTYAVRCKPPGAPSTKSFEWVFGDALLKPVIIPYEAEPTSLLEPQHKDRA